ncbi:hypothetical protein EQW78_17345 [Oerskovia turbata]|uniref:Uncharacterized protein n=1 Tax=Oerskovia turbata TaxID=1713 RepID=A0A4V1N411_9CELL|nr:hypothetical protein [Oerskovia turbata]RXR26393.1 hypothetical protein EQW73_08750 [Oerskovia turbata]RXR30546.1 hypothetical protein EQW78_17345 [Oerskovia turbata]
MTAPTPHSARASARLGRALVLLPLALALAALAACAGGASTGTSTGTGASASTGSGTGSDPSPTVTSPAEPPAQDPAGAPPAPQDAETPEDAFRAWLAASRVPDVATACGYLSPALADRMVAEMTAQGWPGITDCASMITTTAALYAAVGDVAQVEVAVREERPDATVLAVAYAGGDCGTAVMAPAGSTWVVTEQSEEQC